MRIFAYSLFWRKRE